MEYYRKSRESGPRSKFIGLIFFGVGLASRLGKDITKPQ